MPKGEYLRPERIKKTYRDHLLRELKKSHPDFSCAKLGGIFNITRQRVHEILSQ